MDIEIYKESDILTLSVAEAKMIIPIMYAYFEDNANGYLAFALDLENRDQAFEFVDILNEIGEPCWYVGDENEEYVFVN